MLEQQFVELVPSIDANESGKGTFHLSNPRAFKNLVRLSQLPHYDYGKVYEDLLKCKEVENALFLGYGLKYALDLGLFELPTV